jgi:hypothetical protein
VVRLLDRRAGGLEPDLFDTDLSEIRLTRRGIERR